MSLLSLLASPVLGTLFGQLGTAASMFISEWKEDKASARRINELKAVAEVKVEETAWTVFGKAVDATAPNANLSPWVNNTQAMVRVVLTGGFLVLIFVVWYTSEAAQRAEITEPLLTMAFTAISFWFGERFINNAKKKK